MMYLLLLAIHEVGFFARLIFELFQKISHKTYFLYNNQVEMIIVIMLKNQHVRKTKVVPNFLPLLVSSLY